MKLNKTIIKDVFVLEMEPIVDSRGYFTRVFAKEFLKENDINYNIVHINRSLTKEKGTIRGMHYQKNPTAEDKIIQCIVGRVFDVVIDIRKNSPTYRKWVGVELSGENRKMMLIPKGCAHGFQTLEKDCLIEYFVSSYYSPMHERGILWSDPLFNVSWPIKKAKLSDKDQKWPVFK